MNYEFKLPDIGEGLAEGEVVKWHVKEGDMVKENQPLCNVLTDKAEVEIPSPKTGKIAKLFAKEGQKVKVHEPLVAFELEGGSAAASATAPSKISALAGVAQGVSVSATPAVRKLAAEMKVDLAGLKATGPGGRITEQDVRKAAGGAALGGKTVPKAAQHGSLPLAEEKIAFMGIRRRTAEKMAQSAHTVAQVSHMDEADFTALSALRQELKDEARKHKVKLTYLPFILKALVKTLKEYPNLNSTLDEAGGNIIRKLYYNIGIATSAEQGLIVPVIKNIEKKDIWALAADIECSAEKVRAGKIEVSQLQGGTFTITNIGPIGGLFATPIINHPEVGILAVMKIKPRPIAKDGMVAIREMANLVLSFDHRVLDGAEAAHAMNTLIKHLENPRTLL